MCRTPTDVMGTSQGSSLESKVDSSIVKSKVDSSTVMKTPASAWTFRIAWAPVKAVTGESSVRYDVQFNGWGGKRHTFRTVDDVPGIELPNRIVREKVGDTFTVQIRILHVYSNGFGEWSEASKPFSVAKPSPSDFMVAPVSKPKSPEAASAGVLALEALPYAATRKSREPTSHYLWEKGFDSPEEQNQKQALTARKASAKPVKKCGNDGKREGSVLRRLISGFRRATAKA